MQSVLAELSRVALVPTALYVSVEQRLDMLTYRCELGEIGHDGIEGLDRFPMTGRRRNIFCLRLAVDFD